MKKLILSGLMTMLCAVIGLAQATTDYKKSEFFVGYSNNQVDTGLNSDSGNEFRDFFNDRQSFHGFNVSGVYNVSRYVGVKADVSGTYNSQRVSFPTAPPGGISFDMNSSLYNVLGGVQVKDNASEARVKPFGYALVGAGHGRVKIKNLSCAPGVDCSDIRSDSETGLAGAFGGGLDIRINDRVDFRLVKVDYNPIRFSDVTQHNVRFGIGFVFK